MYTIKKPCPIQMEQGFYEKISSFTKEVLYVQIPQIRMQSQYAQISISQNHGKQYIQQPKADLTIEQPKAKMNIETVRGKLTIDQTQAWEDMNLMSMSRRIETIAQDGKNSVLEGMARRSQQGKELMKIENKNEPIREQAIMNSYDQEKSLGIHFIPSPLSVKFNFEPGHVHIQVEAQKPIIHATPKNTEYSYERGDVDIRMEQYETLDIDFENLFSSYV